MSTCSTKIIVFLINIGLYGVLSVPKASAQPTFQDKNIEGLKLKIPTGWHHQVDKSGQVPMIILTKNIKEERSLQVFIFSLPLYQGLKTTRLFAEKFVDSIIPNAQVLKSITLPYGNLGREVVGKKNGQSLQIAWLSFSIPYISTGISVISLLINTHNEKSKTLSLLAKIISPELGKSKLPQAGVKLVGAWQAPGMSITLNRDGSQQYVLQDQKDQGHWWVEKQTLYLAFKDTTYYYQYQQTAQTLYLSDGGKNSITLQRVKPEIKRLKAKHLEGKPLTDQQVLGLIKNYEKIEPDQVAALMARWPKHLSEMLWYLGSLSEDLWWRVCQGSYAQSVQWSGGCAKMAETRKGMEWLMNAPYDNHAARVQANQMRTYILCKSKKLSASTCSGYWAGQTSVSNTIHGMVSSSIATQSKCIEYISTTGEPLGCF